MRIITRAEWGARPPKNRVTTSPSNRVYYVVHHSGGPVTQTVRAIQDWCMDGRGFSDIDYNHLVRGSTGEIYEGRGWDVIGAHTRGYNTSGAGVCIIGTDQCSDAAKVATRWLYAQYNQRCMKTLKIRGHRDLATTGTDCPGDRNYAWVHAGMPAPTAPEEDMDLTADNLAAIGRAVWGQEVGRTGRSTHDTLFTDMQNDLTKVTATSDQLLKLAVSDDVDEAAIAKAVLAGMDYRVMADAVMAALPKDQAQQFIDALTARLAD